MYSLVSPKHGNMAESGLGHQAGVLFVRKKQFMEGGEWVSSQVQKTTQRSNAAMHFLPCALKNFLVVALSQ